MTVIDTLLELDRVLDYCSQQASSVLGKRRVLESQPLNDLAEIRRQLALVQEMAGLLGQAALPLQGLSDLSPALRRISVPGALLDRDQYLPLKDLLFAAGAVRRFFARSGDHYPLLAGLAAGLQDFEPIVAAFDRVFDPAGEIRDEASPELKRIRRQREAEARRLHETVDKVLRRWADQKYTQEDAPAYREGRLLVPVKAEHRGKVQGVVQDESATGATIFVEPLEAIVIGNAIRRLNSEELREIHRLLLELCDLVRGFLPDILHALDLLGQFDHIYARARFSRQLNGIAPALTEEPYLRLLQARHPLLVLKEGSRVVPLNLELGGEAGTILVITGPNAGGKTVALKTVGLFCRMAACGLHVPAMDGTVIPVLGALHCDIGDPQSLDQDLSTFTSHVKRLKEALADDARPKLVLLDEIGASTDPAEGSALARAALLHLRDQGALAVVTTHQGTLKVFAHETPGTFNGSMEFDQETLRPTFRFREGLPGSSYALEISARVGFPDDVLQVARSFLGEEKSRLEDLLTRLNESLRQSEAVRREADLKRTEMESLRKLYSERLKELTRTEKERLQKAAQEARELLEGVNRRIEAEVRAIREQVASAAGQVSSASQSLAEGATEQAAGLQETSSSLEEMASMTKQNADNAQQR
ncbi:MAG: endonuclease MutS2, partial [Candidatus Zixiibacteriota bacterium]